MSDILSACLANTQSRSAALVEGAKAALVEIKSATLLAAGLSGMPGSSYLPGQQSQSIATHAEQYKHNTGSVFTSIRPLAYWGASQPVKMGWLKAKKRIQPGRGTRKDALPEWMKEYHENVEVVEDHPFLRCMRRPNKFTTGWALRYVTLASMPLTGKAYWWIKLSEDRPDRLDTFYLPANWIRPNHERGPFGSWWLQPPGMSQPTEIPAEQIMYSCFPDPANPLGALSPTSALATLIVANESVRSAQRMGFVNGINPGHAVVVGRNPDLKGGPGERPMLTAPQRQQVIQSIMAQFRGTMNYNMPVVLDALIENIYPLTRTNREMDFLASARDTDASIRQGYGTSPYLTGGTEPGSRAASAAAADHFVRTSLNPQLECLSASMTLWADPIFGDGDEDLLVWLEPAKAKDMDYELVEEDKLMGSGCMTVNERRTRHGLPPLPGEYGDVAWLPQAMQPVQIEAKKLAPLPAPAVGASGRGALPFPQPGRNGVAVGA